MEDKDEFIILKKIAKVIQNLHTTAVAGRPWKRCDGDESNEGGR